MKRVILITLILVVMLTGCKNNETDAETQETGVNEVTPVYGAIEHVIYEELVVDKNDHEPVSEKDGTTFAAASYEHTKPWYNKSGEIEGEAVTTLYFYLVNQLGMGEPIEQDHFKLYRLTGNEYTEITPSDCIVNTWTNNGDSRLWIGVQSKLIGEMEEGDYRAEYGAYSVDFRLSEQVFEAW